MRWRGSRRPFARLLRRHHDEAIGLVVAEPLARMVACYLRCEPRVQLDERWSCGGFELIEIAPLLLRNGTPEDQPPDLSRWARELRVGHARGTDERQTPGTSTPKANGCPKASGCAARDARRLSFASRSSKTSESARSATTISCSPRTSESPTCWMRTPSRNGFPVSSRLTLWASTTDGPIPSGSRPSKPHRAGRGGGRRPGIHQGHPHRPGPHRQRLHHGQHGLRGRRKADPRPSRKPPASACRW